MTDREIIAGLAETVTRFVKEIGRLEKAIEDERENAAQIAEGFVKDGFSEQQCFRIAEAIREGKP